MDFLKRIWRGYWDLEPGGIPLRHASLMVLLGAGLSAVPLLRTGGYKGVTIAALAVTLVLPLAWLGKKVEQRPLWGSVLPFVALGSIAYATLLSVTVATTASCELDQGAETFVVSVVPGLLLAYGISALIASHLSHARRFVYVLIWIALAADAGYWFLTEPVYRIAHPLAGMMLGPPNETHEVLDPRVLWFALERVMVAVSLMCAATIGKQGWLVAPWRRYVELGLSGGLALSLIGHSADLGYRIDRVYIETEVLQHVERGAGIEHLMARLTPTDSRQWMILEAEFQRERQARQLGLKVEELPAARIYWYADKARKKDYTGASRTKFAKVHLGEIYVSMDSFPPRTVGHELAHITSGAYSDTQLRVPGRLGGLWYNPALVEGFAVAMAWSEFPLSAHEQARIALDKNRLPRLETLFSPTGFLETNLSVAYKASGSFVRYCMDEHGVEAVTKWYGTEDFEGAFGRPLAEVEGQWREMLLGLEVPKPDENKVNRVQTRPAISMETCGPTRADDDLRLAMDAEADDEVERLLNILEAVGDDDEIWYEREKYLLRRSSYSRKLPKKPKRKLSGRNERAYQHLRAMSLWGRGERKKALSAMASLDANKLESEEIIIARVLIRDGYSVEDYRPTEAVDPNSRRAIIWQRDRHPIFGYRLAQSLLKRQRWRSLHELLAGLTWKDFRFPDNLSGSILLATEQMRGLSAFAVRDWDLAERSFEAYIELANTEGRRAYGREWIERTRYFRTHADRLVADLPEI